MPIALNEHQMLGFFQFNIVDQSTSTFPASRTTIATADGSRNSIMPRPSTSPPALQGQ
jgi:hypothetical protein